jgi:hypothetical protein
MLQRQNGPWSRIQERFLSLIDSVLSVAKLLVLIVAHVARDTNGRRFLFVIAVLMFVSLCFHLNLQMSPEVYFQSSTIVHTNPVVDISNKQQSPPFVVFYNIFIPSSKGRAGILNALRIVREQLDQIEASYAFTSLKENETLTVYFTTIGVYLPLMKQLCRNRQIRCQHIGHVSNGFEENTLEPLHEFCQGNPDFRVVYLHSKGSFHTQHGENERWRRHMTRAVVSSECLDPPQSCSVCGLLFSPVWTFFFPGNFWTAHCSHVNKLLPPRTFREKMTEMVDKLFRLKEARLFDATLFPIDTPGYLGIGRYSSEHWIASHPDVIPCDQSTTADLQYWRQEEKSVALHWSMAPRHDIKSPYYRLNLTVLHDIMTNETRSQREYFLLPGFLFKWFELYGKAPPQKSWIWSWFPNGQHWKAAVGKDGKHALDFLGVQ